MAVAVAAAAAWMEALTVEVQGLVDRPLEPFDHFGSQRAACY